MHVLQRCGSQGTDSFYKINLKKSATNVKDQCEFLLTAAKKSEIENSEYGGLNENDNHGFMYLNA